MQKIFTVLTFLLFSIAAVSQSYVLSGKISGKHEALPFATVYVKGTTQGVNSNDEGRYALKLEKGKHIVVFQYVGYAKQEIAVELNENKTLNVTLTADGITLNEVVVDAGENPANAIIRKAIKKKKYYENPADEYSCQSYIKGMERLKNVSEGFKKLVKMSSGEKIDSNDLGVIYFSESESNYFYKNDKEKEVMFSSRVSGESKSFSFNQLRQMKLNFYENLVPIGGFSPRPLVSPLNNNAFLYYEFFLLGTYNEDGRLYNKIKVKARRETDPCFNGTIYIQEDSWRLTGLDLQLTKAQKLNFIDTLSVRQLFAPVNGDSIWMPVNYNFSFTFHIFGISGDGYFNAIVKNYNLHPQLNDNFFSDEVLRIEEGANKKDSVYWNTNRALPLTREETNDYRKKDSAEKIENTDRYKDSVDRVHNKFDSNKLLLGYTYHNTKKRLTINLPGFLTAGLQYNTVEGINLSYGFSAVKTTEDFREKHLEGQVRYGFSNYLWGGELGYSYLYNPKKFSRFGVSAHSLVQQFNQQNPIAPAINSLYTLYVNDNYMKLFRETAVQAEYHTELINGLYFNATVKYAGRDPLRNTSDRLIIDDKSKLFTSNNPTNASGDDLFFKTNNALTAEVSLVIRFRQKYISLPHRKITAGSKYPRLTLTYKKAVPTLNAVADYDLVSASVYDHINLGLVGRFGYRISGGSFLQSKNLMFTDYKHFLGNQTIINSNDYLSSFRLLPYYTYSANQWFLEAHAEQHFNGFIINKIPLIKKLKVQEVVGGHLLMNNNLKQYCEISFGIEKIFKVLRVDYILGYGPGNTVRNGFTLGLVTSF